jgi:hypothetical protein
MAKITPEILANLPALVHAFLERGETDAAKVICAIERERDAAQARLDSLETKLKRYEPIHTFNGLTIDAWKERAEKAEARLAAMTALLGRLRDNHPNNDPGYGVGQMASGKVTQEIWAEVDAALKAAGDVKS